MSERPLCAVRGLLYGGRAVCGSVINAKKCGFDGQCEHQREPVPLKEAFEAAEHQHQEREQGATLGDMTVYAVEVPHA